MPQTNIAADSLGVLTICLVGLLVFLGLFCIIYSFYFHRQIHNRGYIELSYFNGPWIIRIAFILFTILWGFGEILRLNFLKREGRILNAVDFKWQETICRGYIISNLGFSEPCLFLTLAFLLHESLQNRWTDLGAWKRNWNGKTIAFVLLCCFPFFILQLTVILIGVKFKHKTILQNIPYTFTRANIKSKENDTTVALCTYPLLSMVIIGVFCVILTAYFVWIGRRIVKRVINKGMRRRVYAMIFSILSLFPLRIMFLGLAIAVSKPQEPLFESLSFMGFLSLLVCALVNMLLLVYYPISDSLSLRKRRGSLVQLIANETIPDEEIGSKIGSNMEGGEEEDDECISFCKDEEEEEVGGAFVELSLFCPSEHVSPLDSPQFIGWPILPSTAITPIHE